LRTVTLLPFFALSVSLLPPALAQSGMTMPAAGDSRYWAASGGFLGSKPCASCHPGQSATFHQNSMSRALEEANEAAPLQGDIHYTWANAGYSYSIERSGGTVLYKVTDGAAAFATPLHYAFGQGKAGQTYVYEINGQFYESRVSYYEKLRGLDLTVGAPHKPEDLKSAAGRLMPATQARDCFGCHTTGARRGNALVLERDQYQNGVQCESCHGPGSAHVAGIQNGKPAPNSIRSLKGLNAQETSELCGTCHRTWETVRMMNLKGVNTTRFPAYRLANSSCFSFDDRRIACTACHDPHKPLATGDKAYDANCLACHNKSNLSVKKRICPVGRAACTSCHMQRVEPPEAHHAFADHWIRVVRSKDDYPE
jgi:hypothetical protein